ncbi:MAG: Carbohydrate binding family 6 [Candidatus Moranbacteria bacterium GW2011_GWC2_37_73]|nr:MAG: PKD domain containing protein [Parcubacteria group bacterium GW2011_GWC1_36_108]KKQ00141.1 MAG: Carbohydrate binding family 6 [Candidatus Moranbacteria bacterium GW2011_GWD1_36_198]KKQ00213.1 MAG: Carbohydrate binding family 6 [Candidatus Moranbacteria bacterium GW2011_GWD2_36_198]KKQ39554.1 MAG: Carbohydrate binding family 6 [Candidatus Moranbacteria bacterium GW2011_GWC2_37_73]
MLFVCLVFFAACGGGGGGDSSSPVTPPVTSKVPVASFTVEVTGLTAKFNGTATESPTNWYWDFKDGATSSEQNPVHTYAVGSHSPSLVATNAAGSSAKFEAVVNISAPTVTTLKLAPVPALNPEVIPVLVNKSFYDAHPDVVKNAGAAISEVSAVFAKNTTKRYQVGQVKSYTNAQFDGIQEDPSNYYDNDFPGSPTYGGTTLVYFIYKDRSEIPAYITSQYSYTFTTSHVMNGKKYYTIYKAEDEMTVLLGRSEIEKLSPTYFDSVIFSTCQEFMHTLAGGVPEWYGIAFQDRTNVAPILESYSLRALYPKDPMTEPGLWTGTIFSPFNAWLATNNANHQVDMWQIANNLPKVVKVRLVNSLGNPVVGEVKVFGTLTNTIDPNSKNGTANYYIQPFPQPLLQSAVSDANGEVVINNDFSTSWNGKIIKASSGTKIGGTTMTTVELEEKRWKDGFVESYTKNITVK